MELLRNCRTQFLRVLGPFDFLIRLATGRRNLPPLWLRRHAGPLSKFETSASEMRSFLSQRNLVSKADVVLDLGCGPGAMAFEFADLLGPFGRYVGVDVHEPSVLWCQRHFARDDRFRFELADVASPFSDASSDVSVETYAFPSKDSQFDLVIAKSVFTHLRVAEVKNYLREIHRTLRPGGWAVLTFFLFDPVDGDLCAFPFHAESSMVRWRVKERPESAIAFGLALLEELLREIGFQDTTLIQGYWPGRYPITGQDVIVLRR